VNDPNLFRRRRIAAVVKDEVGRSPRHPLSAARRAHARLSEDPAMLALISLAALETAAVMEVRVRGGVRDEDGGWRFPPPDGAA
jgi:hypothetical protein